MIEVLVTIGIIACIVIVIFIIRYIMYVKSRIDDIMREWIRAKDELDDGGELK